MSIVSININRIIAHEISRNHGLNNNETLLSNDIMALDGGIRELLTKRILNIVSSGIHCVDLTVENSNRNSSFDLATNMLYADDAKFIDNSQQLTHKLSSAQTSGSINPGSVIFVQGIADDNNKNKSRFISIIKADPDKGLVRKINKHQITLEYVNNILFGDSSRLIKIAFFMEENNSNKNDDEHLNIRNPEDFSIKVFDHLMQNSTNGKAALYFYKSFLECNLAETAATKTKEFYEITREYINNMNIQQDEKVDLYGDLTSYLRNNDSTVSAQTFAVDYFPEEKQDDFLNHCASRGIYEPITKDTLLIKGKLKKQSIKFTSNVTLTAENVSDSVRNINLTDDGWTTIEIKGEIKQI